MANCKREWIMNTTNNELSEEHGGFKKSGNMNQIVVVQQMCEKYLEKRK